MSTLTPIVENIFQRGFHIVDNFLAEETYLALRNNLQAVYSRGEFKPAKIGHHLAKTNRPDIRNDAIFWLEKEQNNYAVDSFLTAIDQLCNALNQSLFLGLVDYEAHFAVYQPGNFYKKHVDQFITTQDRRISCVYYLNDDWQQEFGGNLRLFDTSDKLLTEIMPLGNRFVCFNSDLPHEVCTAYQTRYSIASWLKVRPMALVT